MFDAMSALLTALGDGSLRGTGVIPWSSPVPSFGDLSNSPVGTLGLNPSNREFVDMMGRELEGPHRRFHTLRSLGLRRWSEAGARDRRLLVAKCTEYFRTNPYDTWFKRLDRIIAAGGASYYGSTHIRASHIDLIPYATEFKWTSLRPHQRNKLLASAAATLGLLLRDSPVALLILNGRSVVQHFQLVSESTLAPREMHAWSLRRGLSTSVTGISFSGSVRRLGGVDLRRKVKVIGFNHNIQSSFGVTTMVVDAIGEWVARRVVETVG